MWRNWFSGKCIVEHIDRVFISFEVHLDDLFGRAKLGDASNYVIVVFILLNHCTGNRKREWVCMLKLGLAFTLIDLLKIVMLVFSS